MLEWLLSEARALNEARRGPEALGRELLGFKDERTARGVAWRAVGFPRAAGIGVRTGRRQREASYSETRPSQGGPIRKAQVGPAVAFKQPTSLGPLTVVGLAQFAIMGSRMPTNLAHIIDAIG